MHRLFAFADRRDAVLMVVGASAAMANGVAMPFLAFLVGALVDAFGPAHRDNVVQAVSKVRAALRPPAVRAPPLFSRVPGWSIPCRVV